MTKDVAIIGANGQIARLVEDRILNEDKNVYLTLFLRNASRLSNLANNEQVTIIDGDANKPEDLRKAIIVLKCVWEKTKLLFQITKQRNLFLQ